MKLPPYSNYKPSGINWIGDVPSAWTLKRLRDAVTLINGYPFDSEFFSVDEGVPLVRIRDISNKTTELRWSGTPVRAAQVIDGDILIGMDGDFNVARWSGGSAMLNQRVCCIRAKTSRLDDRFLFYLLPFPLNALNDITYSTTVKHLSSLDLLKFRFYAPDLPQQCAIADFLDRETARLDTLVGKKRELIEKLKEKRTALISRTVTRGLNPNVKLKPSNIEWLGDIPNHWEVKKLSWLFRYSKGPSAARFTKEYVASNLGDFPVFSGQTENEGLMGMIDNYEFDFGAPVIFVTTVGARAMTTRLVSGKFSLSQNCALIVPRMANLSVRYYNGALRRLFDFERRSISLIMQPSLRFEDLHKFCVPRPPLSEQRAMADYLDRETAKIDKMIEKVEAAIEKLQEYRTALIIAAVTGKIAVRNGRT